MPAPLRIVVGEHAREAEGEGDGKGDASGEVSSLENTVRSESREKQGGGADEKGSKKEKGKEG